MRSLSAFIRNIRFSEETLLIKDDRLTKEQRSGLSRLSDIYGELFPKNSPIRRLQFLQSTLKIFRLDCRRLDSCRLARCGQSYAITILFGNPIASSIHQSGVASKALARENDVLNPRRDSTTQKLRHNQSPACRECADDDNPVSTIDTINCAYL